MELKEQQKAPDFCLPDQDDRFMCLKDFKGKWVVLYFYPRDNTSGCSKEAHDFTALRSDLEQKNAVILGISTDSTASHRSFIAKKGLDLTLLSDQDKQVVQDYGVWQLKKMAGRQYMGIVRSTFLIDPDGVIRKIWTKVKVENHVLQVRDHLTALQNG